MTKSLIISILTVFSLLNVNATRIYRSKYASDWYKVNTHINKTWYLSRVDSNTWQVKGSLKLPLPYFSIHENRNVLYCWDTYFANAGILLIDSLAIYAKNAVDNQFAEIEQIGFVPNCSEPWAFNRSQVPFLSMMVREVYEKKGLADKKWLLHAYEMLLKDYKFWTDTSKNAIENHNTTIPGLQRFYQHATREELMKFYEVLRPRFGLTDNPTDEQRINMAEAWMSEAETGMDFTPRFENRCHQFIAVDLNTNLYRYEMNFALMVKILGLKNQPNWLQKAKIRKELMTKYCWNEKRGMFMDYDFVNKRHTPIASMAAFYPLYTGMATKEQAKRTVQNLSLLEFEFGPAVCEKAKHDRTYQWDYPAGWPPMYYLIIKGLDNYGYKADAKRIAQKYLDITTRNFNKPFPDSYTKRTKTGNNTVKRIPGFIYEKYNIVTGDIYDPEYPSMVLSDWSYGVFVWSLNYLNK